MQSFFMRTTNTMISLHGCAGRFEFGAYVRKYVFWRFGSFGNRMVLEAVLLITLLSWTGSIISYLLIMLSFIFSLLFFCLSVSFKFYFTIRTNMKKELRRQNIQGHYGTVYEYLGVTVLCPNSLPRALTWRYPNTRTVKRSRMILR